MNEKSPNALSMLGDLELKNDDWVKAKETFRAASDAAGGKDSYATLALVSPWCVYLCLSRVVYALSSCLSICIVVFLDLHGLAFV